MPSPAAVKMYNSLSPTERAQVDASIQGNPSGLDDWYQAAAAAGDPRAIRAGGAGQSEDFERFNEGTLTGWAQGYYDPAASKAAGRPQFRSMRGAEGFFDKPTECPPGMGPSGPNETDPCVSYSPQAQGAQAAPGGAGAAPGGSQGGFGAYSPLWDMLLNQGGHLRQYDQTIGDNTPGISGGVMGGGGIWYQPTAAASGKALSIPGQPRAGAGPATPYQPFGAMPVPGDRNLPGAEQRAPASPFGLGPVTPGKVGPGQIGRGPIPGMTGNSLQSAIMPYQSGYTNPGALGGTLQNSLAPQSGGLAGMLMPYQQQKRKAANSWF